MATPFLSRAAGRTAVRLTRPAVSAVLRPRLLLVDAALAAAVLAVFCLGMSVGDISVPVTDVLPALWNSGDPTTLLVVRELRLPRALVGLLAGAAFGLSGALFQTLTRNPLASPDMIGISQGAGAAVVAGMVLGVGPGLGTQTLGLAGALLAALVIYLLAWKRGTTGYRIVLVGIAVAWMCTAATEYLLTKAEIYEAHNALGWLVGNLNARTWTHVRPLAVAVLVLLPLALLLTHWARTLELGDEVARGLGTPVQVARLAMLLAGVGLVAFATAAAGPVTFVALASPQIALRLARTAAPPLVASALTGSLVVLAGDLVARELLPDTELPVGVVTGVLGAPFLLWLLVRANRVGSGG
jgi:iron complex transport system permease protein